VVYLRSTTDLHYQRNTSSTERAKENEVKKITLSHGMTSRTKTQQDKPENKTDYTCSAQIQTKPRKPAKGMSRPTKKKTN